MQISDLSPGRQLGPSEWIEIDQPRVDLFAEATGDRQWIHVDPDRAGDGPFGTTIAHGFLTLSLVAPCFFELVPLEGMTINYGLNRVRFPAPLPVGSRLRCHVRVVGTKKIDGGVELTFEATFEREGHEKPVCVAELVMRQYA